MNLNLSELKIFDQVAQEGSFSRAAVNLGLTQPAVSWSIRKLEENLGLPLFIRSKKGVEPTRAGRTLQARARELIRQWERLTHGLQEGEQAISGVHTLGIHATLAGFCLPRFCPRLFATYPKLELKIEHDLSRIITEGVVNFKYDYGIVVNPMEHPDLVIKELYPDEIKFWVCEQPSSLQDVESEDSVVICNPDMQQTEGLMREAEKRGLFKAKRRVNTTDLKVMLGLVTAGGGIGLLPETVARSSKMGRLKPIPKSPTYGDMISLIWRADTQKSEASKAVREMILSTFTTSTAESGVLKVKG